MKTQLAGIVFGGRLDQCEGPADESAARDEEWEHVYDDTDPIHRALAQMVRFNPGSPEPIAFASFLGCLLLVNDVRQRRR